MTGVSAELTGYRGGTVLPDSPLRPLNPRSFVAIDPITRIEGHNTLNFSLPDSWLNGTVLLEAKVDPRDAIPETNEGNNEYSTTVTFNLRCPVQLGYVPINYDTGGPAGVLAPDPAFMASAAPKAFRKVYPIGSTGQLQYFQILPAITYDGPMDTPENRHLLGIRLRELLALAQWPQQLRSPLSQLVGWLPDMPGITNAVGRSDPSWGSPGGTDQVFWAQAGPLWDWTLAHEIGHNFGLHHPNVPDSGAAGDLLSRWPLYYGSSVIQEVGCDAVDVIIKNPTKSYDLMTYQPDPKLWISPLHYSGDPFGERGLYQELAPPCFEPTPTRTPTPTATPITPVTSTPTPTPTPGCQWYDPFNIVAPPWSWVREDPGGWSTTARPGYLRILTAPGDLAGTTNNARNLLVQPLLSGNFDVSTRLSFAPTAQGQAAGLLLYQDDDNYLFLGRAYDQGNKVIFVWEHAGVRTVNAAWSSAGSPPTCASSATGRRLPATTA